jgi:signal transduction histidine kinase
MTAERTLFPRAMSLAVHELRTPVTVISGYLRMLLKEQAGPLSEKQRKMLEEAERSCARLGGLVAEMSELGKLEGQELSLARAEFDLAALSAELASRMHEGNDRGVRLEVRGCDRPIMVTGDRVRIGAALGALMYAALRERGEPGLIVAECSMTTHPSPSVIVAVGEESLVSSLNRPAGTLPAFDEWRGGLGLALPVARRVIEAHGGALWSAGDGQPRGAAAFRLPLAT